MERIVFERFRELALAQAGIRIGDGKEALVSARVAKRLRSLGMATEREYLVYLENDDGDEMASFLDVLSTNFTSFFREPDHFDLLVRAAEHWSARGQRRLRVWSAASSSGEEAYTMAMVLAESLDAREVDWRILGTDISRRVLTLAREGCYPETALRNVPVELRRKWFSPLQRGGERWYQVREELRRRVNFQRMNLSLVPYPMKGPLDVVFCRNVMIYFPDQVRQRLVLETARLLRPDGLFLIGHSETLSGVTSPFRALRPSVYALEEGISVWR